MGRLLDLKEKFESKKLSYSEFYKDFVATTKKRNATTNTYLEVFEDELVQKAAKLDDSKPAGSLAGLPIGVKDMISMKSKRLGAASKILEGFVAPRSATVTERLENEGAFFVGRANCDEFAMGSSNENSAYGAVKNPLALDRTAGGSSGGSAAAVAAEICVGSLGTDTGGSIRLPASYCGVTGLKPTYGRVSRSGVIAFASSLDQVGPLADDAKDCAALLQAIAGRDSRDATSMPVSVPNYIDEMKTFDWKGKTIGLPKEFFEEEGIQKEVQENLSRSQDELTKLGATFKEISLPSTKYGIASYYLLATAEASSNLARYDGIRYGHRSSQGETAKDLIVNSRSEAFGPEVKRRIMLGCFSLSSGYYDAYYAKAQFVRSKIQQEYLAAFKEVDMIFAPTAPSTAFRLGEKESDPLKLYLVDIFTVSVNLAGTCAISFCIGSDNQQLPIGAQLIGKPFAEAEILGATAAYQDAFPQTKGTLAC